MLVERVRGFSVSNVPRSEMVAIKRSCLVLKDIQEVLCSGSQTDQYSSAELGVRVCGWGKGDNSPYCIIVYYSHLLYYEFYLY